MKRKIGQSEFRTPLNDPKIQRMIDLKRRSTDTFDNSYNDKSNHQIFEHFLIVGPPPDIESKSKNVKPRILFVYPSNNLQLTTEDINIIPDFCFSKGFSQSSSLEFDSDHVIEAEFVFRLHPSGLYGVCSRCFVNPSRIPFFASNETVNYPFCYCFITKYPIFSVHFTILYYFTLLIDRLVDPAGDRLFKKERDSGSQGDSIPDLISTHNFSTWKGFKIPFVIKKELFFLYRIHKHTSENKCASIELSDDLKVFIPSYLDYDELIGNCCFDVLFSSLSISNIVQIFTNVLLEESTILYSENVEKVTLSVLALTALFHKFDLLCNIYVILPKSHAIILQSPFPYLIGVCFRPDDELLEENCFVNLDTHKIEREKIHVRNPQAHNIIRKLNKIFEKHEDKITVPDSSEFEKYDEFLNNVHVYSRPIHSLLMYQTKFVIHPLIVRKIIKCFVTEFYDKLTDMITPFFVSDSTDSNNPITVFNKNLFLKYIDNTSKDFYELFLQTSIFDMYTENKIAELEKKRKAKD